MFSKLVIVGDSFCADRSEIQDWPIILAKLLNLKLEGQGLSGRSWWSTRKWLTENSKLLDNDTLLIICHTEFSRLPAANDIGINTGLLSVDKNNVNNHLKSIDPAGTLLQLVKDFYVSDLYVDDFYKWALNAWISELDSMAVNVSKTIHIPSFGHRDFDAFKNMKNSIVAIPNATQSLRELSMKEIGNKHYFGYDSRRNHLKDHNNYQLAKALHKIVQSNAESGFVEFDNLDSWDFTPVEFKNPRSMN